LKKHLKSDLYDKEILNLNQSVINDIKNLNNDYLFDLAYFVLSVISFKVISKTSKEKSQKQEMLDDLLVTVF